MKTSDWLQGPYVYALYRNYGYDMATIGNLFVVGYGVSGICGIFMGYICDLIGRKKGGLLFVVVFSA